MQKLDHALQLAALGFRVFPLIPNSKKPAVDEWPRKATTDQAIIERYWSTHPDANIGIAGGDGLIILDVDNKNDKRGSQTLTMLELEHGDLPPTLISQTPTGGLHMFLSIGENVHIKNSVEKIGHGLDLRAAGGYVVAPGSTLDGKPYEWVNGPDSASRSAMPDWLIELAGRAPDRLQRQQDAIGELDTQWSIDQATRYLNTADPAIQGAHGDDATYRIACRILDFGLTPETALDLMLEHWNERCSPPWEPTELQKKIESASRSRENPIGSSNPLAEFEPDAETAARIEQQAKPKTSGIEPAAYIPLTDDELLPPDWQWQKIAAKKYFTAIIADPGIGKTNLVIAYAVAKAAGRDDIVGPVHGKGRVWFISGEDSAEDIKKRIAGVCVKHNVPWTALGDRLLINSAQDTPVKMAVLVDGHKIKAVDAPVIAAKCIERQVDVLIIDPLVEFHTANENDNGQMAEVMGHIRRIAWDAKLAGIVVHHTRKRDKTGAGQEDDQDSARGARAIGGNVRAMLNLNQMSEKRAKEYAVPENLRRRYLSLDSAKNNLSVRDGKPIWFEQTGVDVGNHGLQVGAVSAVDLAPVQNSEGDATSLMQMAVEGLVATAGAGWASTGKAAAYVQDHDAFFAGKAERTVRERVGWALEAAVEGSQIVEIDGRFYRIERKGEDAGGNSVRYRAVEKVAE